MYRGDMYRGHMDTAPPHYTPARGSNRHRNRDNNLTKKHILLLIMYNKISMSFKAKKYVWIWFIFIFIDEIMFLLILGLLVWVIYPDMKIGLITADLWYT